MTTHLITGWLTGAKSSRPVRTISARVCDLASVKTLRGCCLAGSLAALLAGSNLSLFAQTNGASPVTATNTVVTNTPVPRPQPATNSGRPDYSSFQIINDRNIFNGKRSGQRITSTRSSTQQRSVRVESFTLVGTLLSEEKPPVAFFDGSSSDLRKALKAGGTIGGFTVKEILHAGVRVSQGTNLLDILVGSGMRREDSGPWKSSSGGSYASASSSVSPPSSSAEENGRSYSRDGNSRDRSYSRRSYGESSSSSSSNSSGASTPPADAAEILKRLMEKREKE